MWISYILLIGGHLTSLHYLVTINNVAVNIHAQVFMWLNIHINFYPHKNLCMNAHSNIFISLGDVGRSRIAELYGDSKLNSVRKYQTPFQSACTILYSVTLRSAQHSC